MAEVIRDLPEGEKGRYVPFCELDDIQRNETYEAAGEHLLMAYEIDGYIPEHADLLVGLRNEAQVHFFFGEAVRLDTVY